MKIPTVLLDFASLDYPTAWNLQRGLVEDRRLERRPDTLILLEHEPVFTLGRRAQPAHWGGDLATLQAAGYPVHEVERGGSVTYHGPGQIVGYPILRLDRYCAGPKVYMRLLEEVLIRTLADWGIAGRRIDRLPGIWIGEREKIGAMGVRIVHGITMHGFALNVTVDLAPFGLIIPCGIEGCRATSMAAVLAGDVDRRSVRQRLAAHFAEVFGMEWKTMPGTDRPLVGARRPPHERSTTDA
jgi:lipoyl(octanoyl) transferase